jgi:3-phytase
MKLLALLLAFGVAGHGLLTHVRATDPVPGDADDPSVWIHPTDPSKSLIIATDKEPSDKGGGLYVFGLDGKRKQPRLPLESANNVDVEQNVHFGNDVWDIAVAAERDKRRLAIFRIDKSSGKLSEVSGSTAVFQGSEGEQGAPMGISIYKRPKDGAVFAIVSRKEGPEEGYLGQYRLSLNSAGEIDAKEVRRFGLCKPGGEIEALLVDDELGFVYAAEETFGIRKYHADPDASNSNQELAVFGKTGFAEDREGMGLYSTGRGKGYILCSDQREGGSLLRVFTRDGDHREVAAIETDADDTDGIEVVSQSLGGGFESGMVVMMDSKGKRFLLYPGSAVQRSMD